MGLRKMPNWWMDGQTGRQQWFYRTLPNIESLNRKTNMQIFRWPSARKQFSSATSKNVFLILTSTSLISVIFIGPDDHQFMASNSRGLARVFFGRRVECWLPWLMKKIWDFKLVKMVKFGYLSIYFTQLKLPNLKFIFHLQDT